MNRNRYQDDWNVVCAGLIFDSNVYLKLGMRYNFLFD